MGKFSSSKNAIYQQIGGILPDAYDSSPVYFNNAVYLGGVENSIMAFPIASAKLAAAPSSKTVKRFHYPGAMPVVSASGSSNAIVWAVENETNGILYAYDATNLATKLYDSTQAANARDTFAPNKYITPTIANGKVLRRHVEQCCRVWNAAVGPLADPIDGVPLRRRFVERQAALREGMGETRAQNPLPNPVPQQQQRVKDPAAFTSEAGRLALPRTRRNPSRMAAAALVSDMPNTPTAVIGHEHAPIYSDGDTDRPTPNRIIIDNKPC